MGLKFPTAKPRINFLAKRLKCDLQHFEIKMISYELEPGFRLRRIAHLQAAYSAYRHQQCLQFCQILPKLLNYAPKFTSIL